MSIDTRIIILAIKGF